MQKDKAENLYLTMACVKFPEQMTNSCVFPKIPNYIKEI